LTQNPTPPNPNPNPNPTPNPNPVVPYDFCISFNASGACISCSFRSVLKDGTCIAVSSVCNTWDPVTAACTSCYGGWYLKNGVCSYNNSELYPI